MSKCRSVLVVLAAILIAGCLSAAGQAAPPASGPKGLIVFYSERDGNAEIYVMNPDGSGLGRLTKNTSNEFSPDWLPDGTRIVFESDRDDPRPVACFPNCVSKLYVTDADGWNVTRVTTNPAHDWLPTWSADGTELLFSSNRDGRELDVYASSLDGTNVRRLTNAPGYDYKVVWRR